MSEEYSGGMDMTPVGQRPKNLKRRSSIQKIIHMCNQSYQVFPYVFLWLQHFQTNLHDDVRRRITGEGFFRARTLHAVLRFDAKRFLRSLLILRVVVYLSVALIFAEVFYLVVVTLSFSLPSGWLFFLSCIAVLSVLAFQIFNVALELRKKLRGSFFVKKKLL